MDGNSDKTKTRTEKDISFIDQVFKRFEKLVVLKVQEALENHLMEYEHKESGLTTNELEFLKSHNSQDYEIKHEIIHKRSAS